MAYGPYLRTTCIRSAVARFWADDDGGVATIDWLVLLGGLTAAAAISFEIGRDALGDQSNTVRNELQSTSFEVSWTDYMPLDPNDVPDLPWRPVMLPDPDPDTDDANNGHGNDDDGCDASNPGNAPQCQDDDTDDDGTPGNSGGNTDDDDDDDDLDDGGTVIGGGRTVPSGPVQGCPSVEWLGTPFAGAGDDLDDSTDFDVIAGGDTDLRDCDSMPNSRGYFTANPTMTVTLSDLGDYDRIQILVEEADCDTVLLVRDATGEWHFNNNGGSGKNARVRIDPATDAEGTVDIWVGTGSGGTCDAEIEIKAQD